MTELAITSARPDDKDCWRTPPFIVHWAARRWGVFGVDLAADDKNHVCDYWLGEGSPFEAYDALAFDWSRSVASMLIGLGDEHGWCNPPYSNIDPWITRAIEARNGGFSTTMLIPAMPGEARFRYISKHASEIVFIIGRLAFLGRNEKPVSGNRTGSCLVHFRAYDSGAPRVLWIERNFMRDEVA